jgi:hypothetical protein
VETDPSPAMRDARNSGRGLSATNAIRRESPEVDRLAVYLDNPLTLLSRLGESWHTIRHKSQGNYR